MGRRDDFRRIEGPSDTKAGFFRVIKNCEDNKIPCLTVLSGTRQGDVVVLPIGRSIIGRAPSALVSLDDYGVSRFHAALEVGEQCEVTLVDLKSTNGTYLNGFRIKRDVVHDRDRILIGSETTLELFLGPRDELETTAPRRLGADT